MPKTKISEYSTTNSANTDIEGINIDEGCAPSGINNAIRELMVHLKEFQTGASGDAFTFAGGTLMSGTNTISGAAIISGNINSSGTNTFSGSNFMSFSGGSSASPSIYFASDTNTGIFSPAADTIAFTEGGAESMRIDSSGNVGIGTSSPTSNRRLDAVINANASAGIRVVNSNAGTATSSNTLYNNGTISHEFGILGTGYSTYGVLAASDAYIYASGDKNIAFGADGANAIIKFGTGSGVTERMRIDSSGNVGIGNTTPRGRLSVGADLNNGATDASTGINLKQTSTTAATGIYIERSGERKGYYIYLGSGNDGLGFQRNNAGTKSDVMTLDRDGNVLVGTTSAKSKFVVNDGQISVGSVGSGGNGIYLYINDTLSDNSYMSRASAGNGTTTWYIGNQTITTSSDIRLKDNIKPTERNAIELLNQWEIVDHTWNDPSDQCENNRNSRGVWTGVVAQQVQPITPWLVNKPTEEVNKDGTINPWTMDFGYAVPLLVKAIQELKAELDTVKAELATLKG